MKITYRPEIDGLRAISILAAIIYQSNFFLFGDHFFKGGFIGVDIFFVISGYLITNIILKEIYKTKKFSFTNFYERRARRILPALLAVMIVSSIVGYFILLPDALISLSKSIIAGIFFVYNVYLWGTGFQYGEPILVIKPFVNLWTLSVEEQFYISFPILLLLTIKFFKKFTFLILFFLFFSSLIAAEWMSKTDLNFQYNFFGKNFYFFDKFNFYFIYSRIFELILGSFLAYFELNYIRKYNLIKSDPILSKVCPSIGILLIIYSFIFFDIDSISHPSFNTLIPLVGVVLIIFFSKKNELITKLLSSKLFVFFGLISYSLYLWHYPFFSYLRYIVLFEQFWIKSISIILIIIFSILSYKYIEKPFRNKKIISTKKALVTFLIVVIILLNYNLFILKREGVIEDRIPNIFNKQLKFNSGEIAYNKNGTTGNVLLIGDSHAESLAYNLNAELKGYNFLYMHTSLYLPGFNNILIKNKKINENFIKDNQKITNFIEKNKNLIVVISQRWSPIFLENYFDEECKCLRPANYFEPINFLNPSEDDRQKYLIDGLKLTFNNIIKQGHKLIIVYSIPEMNSNVPRLMLREILFNKTESRSVLPILTTNYYDFIKRNYKVNETLNSFQDLDVHRVYPELFFCNTIIKNECIANDEKDLFYYDSHHLSLQGSKYIVDSILNIIKSDYIYK